MAIQKYYAEDVESINQLQYTKNSNPFESDVRFTCAMQPMHVGSRLHSLQACRLVGRWGVRVCVCVWGGGGGGGRFRNATRAEPLVSWVGAGGQGLSPHTAQPYGVTL